MSYNYFWIGILGDEIEKTYRGDENFMKNEDFKKKVFISYAWTSEEYQKKVIDLATKLRTDGIVVILDKWDLDVGADKFAFMEKSIAESDKVLILCNKEYKKRADSRWGGAGHETMIIAPEVYEKNAPEKFIPIIMESSCSGKKYVPQYLKSFIYIDFTGNDIEKQYKDLVYAIYGFKPDRKPKVGEIPDYIKERIIISDISVEKENTDTTNTVTRGYGKTNFYMRLSKIIEMINLSNHREDFINLEVIGDMMGLESVNELNKYYYGEEEPSYEFIKKLCRVLGINEEWMQFGKETPYKNDLQNYDDAEQMLEELSCEEEIIFFTVEDIYRRELGVIVKKDKYIFKCYPSAFVFHSDVGNGGEIKLCSLYKFLKKLNQMKKMPSGIYFVSKEEFYDLLSGKIYPGLIKKPYREYKLYMLDDFISLYTDEEEKDKYIEWYGETFVDSQKLIKERLAWGY